MLVKTNKQWRCLIKPPFNYEGWAMMLVKRKLKVTQKCINTSNDNQKWLNKK